jgi:hypothetical protein
MRCRHFEFVQEIFVQPATVVSVFTDYSSWGETFPATIKSAQLLDDRGDRELVEVHHKRHGPILNVIQKIGPNRIALEEYKPRYEAIFLMTVRPAPLGSSVTLDLELRAKGPGVWLLPFVAPFVRRQVIRLFLQPLKLACERKAFSMPADRSGSHQEKSASAKG